MIHTTKNIKWVIGTSIACILLGILTFFTFINQTFIELNDFNLRILLSVDLILLLLLIENCLLLRFFSSVILLLFLLIYFTIFTNFNDKAILYCIIKVNCVKLRIVNNVIL